MTDIDQDTTATRAAAAAATLPGTGVPIMSACTGAMFCPAGGVNAGAKQNLEADTTRLLQSRLRVFVPFVAAMEALASLQLLFVTAAAAAVIPAIMALVSGAAAVVLWSRPKLTEKQLAVIKIIIFGGMVVGITINLVVLLSAELAAGDQAGFVAHVNRIPGLWIVVIFAYAMFIPETWQRALGFVLLCCLAGLAGVLALRARHGPISGLLGETEMLSLSTYGVLMVLIGGGIAVFGIQVINSYRRNLAETRAAGMYRLVHQLGMGGMGEVWKAEHRLLARPAAIKMIRPDLLQGAGGADPGVVTGRFEREARATAALQSPHTVQLYDFGVTRDGTFFYVMEYLRGLDLQELIERFGPVPAARAVHLLRQAADSLHEAHERGMVHRDVKPANIHIGRFAGHNDWVKVLDFGLVKSLDPKRSDGPQLTQEGMTTGTPAFFPPEMVGGASVADARSDVYALAAVGYWLLSGQLVFDGTGPMDMIIKHVKEDPVPPSQRAEVEIPAALDRVILAGLAKPPGERPQSMREFAQLLSQVEILPAWTEGKAAEWWSLHMPEEVEPLVA